MKISQIFTSQEKEKKAAHKSAPLDTSKKTEKKPNRESVLENTHFKPAKNKLFLNTSSLKSFHITEKATDLLKNRQYVFKVQEGANKKDIKEAVEDLYKVNVLDVNVITIPKKKKRWKGGTGWSKGYKKAIVKIKEGQEIEILHR